MEDEIPGDDAEMAFGSRSEGAAGYALRLASAWLRHERAWEAPGLPTQESYGHFCQVVEAATDLAWLGKGDAVLLKLAMNSGKPWPATSDPWLAACAARLFQERGAGRVAVADQAGIEHVRQRPGREKGSSRSLFQGNRELVRAVRLAGAEALFFEERGWDQGYVAQVPAGQHSWPEPLMVTRALEDFDHLVYLPRVASHALADVSLGLKLAVGFLREDSRALLHASGEDFCRRYEEVNQLPLIAERLRLVLGGGCRVLTTIGPDSGCEVRQPWGPLIASQDLLAHELLAMAWLAWCRLPRFSGRWHLRVDRWVAGNRNAIHRAWLAWLARQRGGCSVADVPAAHRSRPWEHPAVRSCVARRGGLPEKITWTRLGPWPEEAPPMEWIWELIGV